MSKSFHSENYDCIARKKSLAAGKKNRKNIFMDMGDDENDSFEYKSYDYKIDAAKVLEKV